jgi:hypothetical protein
MRYSLMDIKSELKLLSHINTNNISEIRDLNDRLSVYLHNINKKRTVKYPRKTSNEIYQYLLGIFIEPLTKLIYEYAATNLLVAINRFERHDIDGYFHMYNDILVNIDSHYEKHITEYSFDTGNLHNIISIKIHRLLFATEKWILYLSKPCSYINLINRLTNKMIDIKEINHYHDLNASFIQDNILFNVTVYKNTIVLLVRNLDTDTNDIKIFDDIKKEYSYTAINGTYAYMTNKTLKSIELSIINIKEKTIKHALYSLTDDEYKPINFHTNPSWVKFINDKLYLPACEEYRINCDKYPHTTRYQGIFEIDLIAGFMKFHKFDKKLKIYPATLMDSYVDASNRLIIYTSGFIYEFDLIHKV